MLTIIPRYGYNTKKLEKFCHELMIPTVGGCCEIALLTLTVDCRGLQNHHTEQHIKQHDRDEDDDEATRGRDEQSLQKNNSTY